MVWFTCDACGDSIKKPKLANHIRSCRYSTFTCIDCNACFDSQSVHGHNICVTEHEKYALGATKPGGYAESGYVPQNQSSKPRADEPSGTDYLSTRPPWKCSICNVACTSKDSLLSHATGLKHVRRVRAAAAAAAGVNGAQQQQQQEQEQVGPASEKKPEEDAGSEQPESKKKRTSKAEADANANGTAANGDAAEDDGIEENEGGKKRKIKKGKKEDDIAQKQIEEEQDASKPKKKKKLANGDAGEHLDDNKANGTLSEEKLTTLSKAVSKKLRKHDGTPLSLKKLAKLAEKHCGLSLDQSEKVQRRLGKQVAAMGICKLVGDTLMPL